jgi:hypothetical protein
MHIYTHSEAFISGMGTADLMLDSTKCTHVTTTRSLQLTKRITPTARSVREQSITAQGISLAPIVIFCRFQIIWLHLALVL